MSAFEYVALDPRGRSRKGVLSGDSSRQVRAELRLQGLQPVTVTSVRERQPGRGLGFGRQRGVSAALLALLTRQLATMVRSGMPLEECFRALEAQFESRRKLRAMLAGVRAQITEGESLHAALASYPEVFPEMYRVMVEAGEASGHLDEVLERLAIYTEDRQALRQKLTAALIYPCLITLVAVGVVVALVTYVVPEVVRVFDQTGQTLPLLTRGLITISDFLRSYGPGIAVMLCGLAAGVRIALRRPALRWSWDRLVLAVPIAGSIIRRIEAARVTRTLAILAASGVPLLEALQIAARTVVRLPFRRATQIAATSVREGGRFHTALAGTGYFPPLLLHMLGAGEDSGELDDMLVRAATHQERELQSFAATFGAVVEPLIILVMGGVVLLIVLAILMPIFDMNQLVTR